MTTYVWKVPKGGALEEVQVGAADVVAAVAAANTAWGWVGGFEGIKNVLSKFPRLRDVKDLGTFGVKLQMQPSSCRIITSSGVMVFQDSDEKHAFGGHPITQLIGSTICALAYKLGEERAIQLFMDYLASFLLMGAEDGMVEALYSQLVDNAKLIVNEGATRELPALFSAAVTRLNLPQNPDILAGAFSPHDQADYGYIVGLLRWIAKGSDDFYLTRSAETIQVAAYLKEIGYMIGHITVWDGVGHCPDYPRGVVLVVGGEDETDHLMLEGDPSDLTSTQPVTHHYHQETTGSLLFNLFGSRADMLPHTYDSYFLTTRKYLLAHLSFHWTFDNRSLRKSLNATPEFKPIKCAASNLARALAAIYFPLFAEQLGPCYEVIAQGNVINAVRGYDSHEMGTRQLEVIQFEVITLSILLVVAEILGGQGYGDLTHSTEVSVMALDNCIEEMSRFLNKSFSTGLMFWQAVAFVAVFHCGAEPSILNADADSHRSIVGYRDGRYTVLPSLLFHLTPTSRALGLSCQDTFFSIPVQQDNYVRSEESEPWLPVTHYLNIDEREVEMNVMLQGSYVGPPIATPADADIHLSVERLSTSSTPYLCLAARHNGYLIGTVGINCVLKTLGMSLPAPRRCPRSGHASLTSCRTLQASHWVQSRRHKPTDQRLYSNYIAVAGHGRWAIFLAGQVAQRKGGGYLVSECFECMIEHARESAMAAQWKNDAGGMFIGYGDGHVAAQSASMVARRSTGMKDWSS